MMDLDAFRAILRNSSIDIWTLLDTLFTVASLDYISEFEGRKEGIIEQLNALIISREASIVNDIRIHEGEGESPSNDEEQTETLDIKENRQDPNQKQSEDSLINFLQNLTDIVTSSGFRNYSVEEAIIAKRVSRLRYHSSNEVQRLAKNLIGKWKYLACKRSKSKVSLLDVNACRIDHREKLNEEQFKVATPLESTPKDSHQVPQFSCSSYAIKQRETNVDLDLGISIPQHEYPWRRYDGSSDSNKVNLQSEPCEEMPPREVQPKLTQPAPTEVVYRRKKKETEGNKAHCLS